MKENKLRARWGKGAKDILVTYPMGMGTCCDCNYMLGDIFTREFEKEMKERGYDIKTLKFEIKVDEKSKTFKEKFPTLAKELEDSKEKTEWV